MNMTKKLSWPNLMLYPIILGLDYRQPWKAYGIAKALGQEKKSRILEEKGCSVPEGPVYRGRNVYQ